MFQRYLLEPPQSGAAAQSARHRPNSGSLHLHSRSVRRLRGFHALLLIGGGTLLVSPPLRAQTDSSTAEVGLSVEREPVALRILRLLPPRLATAAGSQITGTPKQWGRTWRGYGSRVGDQLGVLVVGRGVRVGVQALLPWEPDPTDCSLAGKGTAFPRKARARVACAWRSTTTMQTAGGETRPNLPFAVGLVAATVTSLSWRKERTSAVEARSYVAQRLAISFGATVGVSALFPPRAPVHAPPRSEPRH